MDHHYCPRLYTKQWTNKEGKLLHYTVAHGKIISHYVVPKGTGYEANLYAKINTSEKDKHTIETEFYKQIDNDAAVILQKIIKHGLEILNTTERINWCRFIISMLTRHPSIVNNAKAMEAGVINRQMELLPTHQQADYKIRFKNEIDYWQHNAAVETLANMATLKSKYDLGICEKYTDTLMNMVWWITDFSSTHFKLLTSDYPVVISPLRSQPRKYDKINDMLLSGDYHLSLPITPQLCFYAAMQSNAKIIDYNKPIKSQNNVTVLKAKNYVYASDSSQEYFIKKRLKLRI